MERFQLFPMYFLPANTWSYPSVVYFPYQLPDYTASVSSISHKNNDETSWRMEVT
jgi:hypothetical protein